MDGVGWKSTNMATSKMGNMDREVQRRQEWLNIWIAPAAEAQKTNI